MHTQAKRITKATLEREDQERAQSMRRPRSRVIPQNAAQDTTELEEQGGGESEQESSEDEEEEFAPLPVMGVAPRASASTWVRLLRVYTLSHSLTCLARPS
jgi:hypothetical protein